MSRCSGSAPCSARSPMSSASSYFSRGDRRSNWCGSHEVSHRPPHRATPTASRSCSATTRRACSRAHRRADAAPSSAVTIDPPPQQRAERARLLRQSRALLRRAGAARAVGGDRDQRGRDRRRRRAGLERVAAWETALRRLVETRRPRDARWRAQFVPRLALRRRRRRTCAPTRRRRSRRGGRCSSAVARSQPPHPSRVTLRSGEHDGRHAARRSARAAPRRLPGLRPPRDRLPALARPAGALRERLSRNRAAARPGRACEGADASHAWFAVYVPDARLGRLRSDQRSAARPTGTSPPRGAATTADVAPLKGVIFGGGAHTLEVAVDMERLD